jgi:hypothetical protein
MSTQWFHSSLIGLAFGPLNLAAPVVFVLAERQS